MRRSNQAPSRARTLPVTRSAIRSSTFGSARFMPSRPLACARSFAGWKIRAPDLGDEPGLEAFAQPVLDRCQLLGQTITGDNQLTAGLVQSVERVEELLLGPGFAGEKLDVVDKQHVDRAVGLLEALDRACAERCEEVVRKRLGRRVTHGCSAAKGDQVVADRVQQMGLAQPGRGEQKKRVVRLARHLCHRKRRGVGETVALPITNWSKL